MAGQGVRGSRARLTSAAYRMLGSRWRVGRISDWVEGDGQLSSLISVRAELGRGDLRALYLGWLLCAQSGDLGRKADAKAFEIAVKTLTGEAAGRALLDAGSPSTGHTEPDLF